jgi:hypothetical protein
LSWPQIGARTLHWRVRRVAIWRRPKLTARGDPAHDQAVAGIVARLTELRRRSVVLAEDKTHMHLLPHVRASWTLCGMRLALLFQCVEASIENVAAGWLFTGRARHPRRPDLVRRTPGLLTPVQVDGRHCFDGGLIDSIPSGGQSR